MVQMAVCIEERSLDSNGDEMKVQEVEEEKKDANLVTWSGQNDPSNPLNWPFSRRLWLAALLSLLVTLSPVASTMLAPANTILRKEFNINSSIHLQLVFSIYNLGYGLGPLLLAPFSEMYGRLPALHLCTTAFLIFNAAAGFSHSALQLGALRFLSAFVGSTVMSIGGGVLGDSFAPHEFGIAAAVYGLFPLIGPVIGPTVGGFAAQYASWRWMCWGLSLVGLTLQAVALVFLRETYAPTILRQKRMRLVRATSNDELYTVHDLAGTTRTSQAWTGLSIRPIKLLATQPLVQFLSLYLAFLTGVCYIIEYTFPTLWTVGYGESTAIGGLNYIALGIGFISGALICSFLNDRIYKHLSTLNNNTGRPEYRIPVLFLGALLAPIGLFSYGWAAQFRTHWILPDLGMTIYTMGFVIGIVNTHMYVVDYYGSYAASAIAAVSFAQALFGFFLPLFGPALYVALGYGWGNSLMGFVAIAIGWPLPVLLWRFGEKLQKWSPYSARQQGSESDSVTTDTTTGIDRGVAKEVNAISDNDIVSEFKGVVTTESQKASTELKRVVTVTVHEKSAEI